MEIEKVTRNKEKYLPLLLMADASAAMVETYLEDCELFAVEDRGEAIGVAAVVETEEGDILIKNIAVSGKKRGKGYGKLLVDYVLKHYKGRYKTVYATTTGLDTACMEFFAHCGFSYSHTVEGFYVENYPMPILDDRARAQDVLYFKKAL